MLLLLEVAGGLVAGFLLLSFLSGGISGGYKPPPEPMRMWDWVLIGVGVALIVVPYFFGVVVYFFG